MKLLMRSFVFLSLLLAVVTGYATDYEFTTFTIKSCGFPLDAYYLNSYNSRGSHQYFFNKEGKVFDDYPQYISVRIDYRRASVVCEALHTDKEKQDCFMKMNKITDNLKSMGSGGFISFDRKKPPATYRIDKFSCF